MKRLTAKTQLLGAREIPPGLPKEHAVPTPAQSYTVKEANAFDVQAQAAGRRSPECRAVASLPLESSVPPKVLLGVTGAIACYKVCALVRLMVRAGWQVRVVPTARALEFVGEITWRTLSQHPVERCAFAEAADWHPRHIALAGWCDLFVVAPCSANTLAKLAHGLADNLLTQTALACPKPLVVAPAMNAQMWQHPATQANAEALKARGASLLDPEAGELACGVCGTGRLPEPEDLFEALRKRLCAEGGGER